MTMSPNQSPPNWAVAGGGMFAGGFEPDPDPDPLLQAEQRMHTRRRAKELLRFIVVTEKGR
jgi:hypothetical protein